MKNGLGFQWMIKIDSFTVRNNQLLSNVLTIFRTILLLHAAML